MLSADYNASTFQLFGDVGYKLNVSPCSIVDPYVNLAYMRVAIDLTLGDFQPLLLLIWAGAMFMASITASFVGGSNAFTFLRSSIGRDTALIKAGFDCRR